MNNHQKLILKVAAGWMLLLFLFPPPTEKVDSSPSSDYRNVGLEAGARHNLYPFILQQLLLIEKNKLRLKRNAVAWRRLLWEYRVLLLVAFVLLVASRGPQNNGEDDDRDGDGPIEPDPRIPQHVLEHQGVGHLKRGMCKASVF